MALAAVFLAYVAAGLVVGPEWGRAASGLLLPTTPLDRDARLVVVATVGTTLAPWGLSFIQSYAVDKKLTPEDLPYERADVVTGSVLTGVIGFFVVVTCAETLHAGSHVARIGSRTFRSPSGCVRIGTRPSRCSVRSMSPGQAR